MFVFDPGPLDIKYALYPNDRILAVDIPSSNGSHRPGQNKSGSLFLDHVCLLVPPRPCTNIISTRRLVPGS